MAGVRNLSFYWDLFSRVELLVSKKESDFS